LPRPLPRQLTPSGDVVESETSGLPKVFIGDVNGIAGHSEDRRPAFVDDVAIQRVAVHATIREDRPDQLRSRRDNEAVG
jgi:hypothetical protein